MQFQNLTNIHQRFKANDLNAGWFERTETPTRLGSFPKSPETHPPQPPRTWWACHSLFPDTQMTKIKPHVRLEKEPTKNTKYWASVSWSWMVLCECKAQTKLSSCSCKLPYSLAFGLDQVLIMQQKSKITQVLLGHEEIRRDDPKNRDGITFWE